MGTSGGAVGGVCLEEELEEIEAAVSAVEVQWIYGAPGSGLEEENAERRAEEVVMRSDVSVLLCTARKMSRGEGSPQKQNTSGGLGLVWRWWAGDAWSHGHGGGWLVCCRPIVLA